MEENVQEMKENEQMEQKLAEMQDKIVEGINQAMSTTAESLDSTADKIHETAEFFRGKNADTLRNDSVGFVKKYPGQTVFGAAIVGFLIGLIVSR